MSTFCPNGEVDGRIAEMKSKKEEFREKSIDELLASEERYLHQLYLLKQHFINPILTDHLLPQHLFTSIFGNIAPIEALNIRLYEELRRNSATDTIGHPFLKLSHYLRIYSTYAQNYEGALTSLTDYEEKNKNFRKFIENQECRPELNGLKLNSLLITPIQRIPRYILLLHEIIKNTSKDHQDYSRLVDAAKAIEDVANYINLHVSQSSDLQVLLKVQKALTNTQPKIIAPGRTLIRHGIVRKLSRRGSGVHDRALFLFTDMIMYCKPKNFNYLEPDSIECCCILPLSNCSVYRIFGVTFKVCCKEEDIKFYSDSVFNCNLWIESIQNAIRKNSANRATLRKGASSKILLTRKMIAKHKVDNLSVIMRKQAKKRSENEDAENYEPSPNSVYQVPRKKPKNHLSVEIDNNENIVLNSLEKKSSLNDFVINHCTKDHDNEHGMPDENNDAVFVKETENFDLHANSSKSNCNKYALAIRRHSYFGKNVDISSCTLL